MDRETYALLLMDARRVLRGAGSDAAGEAADLLHEALIVAAAAGRMDLGPVDRPLDAENRAWLVGVMKNKRRMAARASARRHTREIDYAEASAGSAAAGGGPVDREYAEIELAHRADRVLEGLSPASRQVAALVLHDLDRAEIAWILRITPEALRQRMRLLRAQLRSSGGRDPAGLLARAYAARQSAGDAPAAALRKHLISILTRHAGIGTADPDGHGLIFSAAPSHVLRSGGK